MWIIQIEKNSNGSHNDHCASHITAPPEGWAIIPEDMECENLPFGDVEVADIDGIMTVTKWIAGETPATPKPTPTEEREAAYNTEKLIEWDDEMLTVTEAAQQWQYYAAEGSEKAGELTLLIAGAKAKIRQMHPDSEVAE